MIVSAFTVYRGAYLAIAKVLANAKVLASRLDGGSIRPAGTRTLHYPPSSLLANVVLDILYNTYKNLYNRR